MKKTQNTPQPDRISERQYHLTRELLDVLPSAVLLSDVATGRILLYNARAVRLWGKEPSTLQPREEFYEGFSFLTIEGKSLPHEQLPTSIVQRTRQPIRNQDFIVRRPDGTKQHVLISAHLIADSTGALNSVMTFFEDATHNHRVRIPSLAQGTFRLATENTNEAVWDLHIATDHMDWNREITALYGYDPQEVELTGSWWLEHIHPEDRLNVKESIRQTLQADNLAWHCEYRFRRADGNYAHTIDRGYVMRTEAGTPVRMIGAMQDISSNLEATEILRRQAQHDTLTGLPNRTLIEERLAEVLAESDPRAVMFIDIDEFKSINDGYGHDAGDDVLKAVANQLQQGASGAFVGRLAGDEFIVVAEVADTLDAANQAEKVLHAVQSLTRPDGQPLSVSIGVTMHPSDGASISGLLKNADRALYKAKRSGKGRITFY